jgi:hypothetical protein
VQRSEVGQRWTASRVTGGLRRTTSSSSIFCIAPENSDSKPKLRDDPLQLQCRAREPGAGGSGAPAGLLLLLLLLRLRLRLRLRLPLRLRLRLRGHSRSHSSSRSRSCQPERRSVAALRSWLLPPLPPLALLAATARPESPTASTRMALNRFHAAVERNEFSVFVFWRGLW